jgi:hypothetical protein
MRRLLLLLPLCVLMGPAPPQENPSSSKVPFRVSDKVADAGQALPSDADMERLAREDPVEFLRSTVRRYQREVKGYHCFMQKQERIDGRLRPTEDVEVWFKEKPHSVVLRWIKNPGRAEKALYVEGQNGEQALVRPYGMLARKIAGDVITVDPVGEEARQSGRYTLPEFGIKKGALRTLASWEAAQKADALHVEYLGIIKVKEAGDRPCYALRRVRFAKPEADGVTELTVYYDKETWLQVGSVLKGEEGKVIGAYFFRDIELNPKFKPDQFQRVAVES